jgi:hypothetical protein
MAVSVAKNGKNLRLETPVSLFSTDFTLSRAGTLSFRDSPLTFLQRTDGFWCLPRTNPTGELRRLPSS